MKSQVDSTVDEKRDKSSKPPVVSFSMDVPHEQNSWRKDGLGTSHLRRALWAIQQTSVRQFEGVALGAGLKHSSHGRLRN
jgi:hypothetical protein